MTYDSEGQTTAKGTETYTFNVRHQLETVTGSGYEYQYTYDGTGHRVKAVYRVSASVSLKCLSFDCFMRIFSFTLHHLGASF